MFIVSLLFFSLMIPSILILVSLLISKKKNTNQEKMSPFECGFDPMSCNRLPFSIQFFLISMIFLIFDIEITMLIPLVLMTSLFSLPSLLLTMFFLSILIIGLYFEYTENSLEWKM